MKKPLIELSQKRIVSWLSIVAKILLALLAAILLFTYGAAMYGGPIRDIKSGIWWEQQTEKWR